MLKNIYCKILSMKHLCIIVSFQIISSIFAPDISIAKLE